jgi:hypothetical protein
MDPLCDQKARATLLRPPHPAPRFVTTARTPLLPGQDARKDAADLGFEQSDLFFCAGLDDPNQIESSE